MLLIPYGDRFEDKSEMESRGSMEMAHHPSARQEMKVITIVISLACFCRGALADDQATPSPTPVYLYRPARPGALRHQEEIERRRELEAQAKADRRSAVAAQAEARAAARVREQAQRKVEAEERALAANATPHATSDLMSRMGFSAQEIAAQKAREQSLKPEAKETTDVTSQAGRQSEQSRPAVNSGTPEDHLTRSHAEKPTSPSPAPDSGSH
jgi:hypothetical protein